MNYFRAIMRSGEASARVLELLGDVLIRNPANYSAWQRRREVCEILREFDVHLETEFSDAAVLACPKNYQIWFVSSLRLMLAWNCSPWTTERYRSPVVLPSLALLG